MNLQTLCYYDYTCAKYSDFYILAIKILKRKEMPSIVFQGEVKD